MPEEAGMPEATGATEVAGAMAERAAREGREKEEGREGREARMARTAMMARMASLHPRRSQRPSQRPSPRPSRRPSQRPSPRPTPTPTPTRRTMRGRDVTGILTRSVSWTPRRPAIKRLSRYVQAGHIWVAAHESLVMAFDHKRAAADNPSSAPGSGSSRGVSEEGSACGAS